MRICRIGGRVKQVSIVICTRNRAPALAPMLDALAALQSRHAYEILLVDNASTDETPARLDQAAARLPHVRTLRVDRIGLGAARDAAWRAAEGRIILFTDDDCYVAPDLVDATVEVFDRHPEIGFAGGRILLHDPSDYPVTIDERDVPAVISPSRFTPPGVLQGANMAFRRNALETVGGFDTAFGAGTPFPCEDIDTVAACVWAGIGGRFDPTMVVRHHHGRKAKDYPALMQSYDRGRGAYFAKYVLRSESRAAYLRGWIAGTFRYLHRGNLDTLRRELASARAYLVHRRAWGALVIGAPIAAVTYVALFGAVIANKLRSVVAGGDRRPNGDLPA